MYNIYYMLTRYTLSCSVLPYGFNVSTCAKHPQNLLVCCLITDHRWHKKASERSDSNCLLSWKYNQIWCHNVLCFLPFANTTSKLILNYVDTSKLSSSMLKFCHRWDFLVLYLISTGDRDYLISTRDGDWWASMSIFGVSKKIIV